MSALTGTPGSSSAPVMAPTNQNGTGNANANVKKVIGDLLIDVLMFVRIQLLGMRTV